MFKASKSDRGTTKSFSVVSLRSQLYVMCKGTTVCSRQTLMPSNNIQLSVSVQHNLFPTSIYCMSMSFFRVNTLLGMFIHFWWYHRCTPHTVPSHTVQCHTCFLYYCLRLTTAFGKRPHLLCTLFIVNLVVLLWWVKG